MTWTDIVAWVSLAIGIVALLVTVYAILDVRNQVRRLVELHGNLLCAELVPEMVEPWVIPTKTKLDSNRLQKFLMVQRFLHPEEYDAETGQRTVQRQGLWLANELVERGMAVWKPHIDLAKVRSELAECARETNIGRLKGLFGDRIQNLFE